MIWFALLVGGGLVFNTVDAAAGALFGSSIMIGIGTIIGCIFFGVLTLYGGLSESPTWAPHTKFIFEAQLPIMALAVTPLVVIFIYADVGVVAVALVAVSAFFFWIYFVLMHFWGNLTSGQQDGTSVFDHQLGIYPNSTKQLGDAYNQVTFTGFTWGMTFLAVAISGAMAYGIILIFDSAKKRAKADRR